MQSIPASPAASTLVCANSDAVAAITIDGLTPDQSALLFMLTILGHKGADQIAAMNVQGNPGIKPLILMSTLVLPGEVIAELATVAWIGTMRAVRDYLSGLPEGSEQATAFARFADMFTTGEAPMHGEAAYQAMMRDRAAREQEASGEFAADLGPSAPTEEGSAHGEAVMDDDGGPAVDGLELAH